ncbi:MAG: methyl-accepting chemotaxis protein [Cytophagaceae bacterium]|nr:methyl-accepting chemotaxis protein [Gemmatimonadaceae bacterium]
MAAERSGALVSLGSLRQRLFAGFGLLALLFGVAGLAARAAVGRMSELIGETLSTVQSDAQLSSRLSSSVTQELAAADRYLVSHDSSAADDFRRTGAAAHRAQREMALHPDMSRDEAALIAAIDQQLSAVEVRYARAHRLVDLGRSADANREAALARRGIEELTRDVQSLNALKTRGVEAASKSLRREADQRTLWVLVIMGIASALGLVVVVTTVGWIARPMRRLAAQARALSSGDFSPQSHDDLPLEFRDLADALNGAAASLSRVVNVTSMTADDVSGSARELANVSEQISASASQMAASMSDISSSADSQVRQLRAVDEALRSIQGNADEVLRGTDEVGGLAGEIEVSARAKRSEIERSLSILVTVRSTVGEAAAEVQALQGTADHINRLVASVGRIAEQTDLLALNAAIEAARAGAAGRGFGVVADEVRKLAEQAQAAADDVTQLTRLVTSRVASTTRAMENGVQQVSEIEGVSRELDSALNTITLAAARTRAAAGAAAEKARGNAQFVASAARSVESVARTAESYAAAAQQVSASTQEQSAACEQMSSASTQLLQGSVQLRELVGGLGKG